jgi:hypothetical protein
LHARGPRPRRRGYGYIALPNGSEVWVGGLDDHERVEKILGMEFVTLFYNECQIPYGSVLMADSCTSQADAVATRRSHERDSSIPTWSTTQFLFTERQPEPRPRPPDLLP